MPRGGAWRCRARLRLIVFALAGGLLAAGCTGGVASRSRDLETGRAGGPGSGGAAQRSGGTLTIALLAPRSLDPAYATRPEEQLLVANLFDGLTTIDPGGAVRPAVASSWSSDPLLRHWRFQLRSDARYANAKPVRAEDFKAAWERLASPKTRPRPDSATSLLGLVDGYWEFAAGRAPAITGIAAPDPTTLTVDLTDPFADFPSVVSSPRLSPVPPDATARPVGDGPFVLAGRFSSGHAFDLVRNRRYYGRTPYLDRVRVGVVPDQQTAWLAFQHGNVRFAPVPPDQVPAARQIAGTSADGRSQPGLLQGPETGAWSLGFNLAEEPASDPRWRQAVSLALDRQRIAAAFAGATAPAVGIAPSGVPGAGQAICQSCAYDPVKARALLAGLRQAGRVGQPGQLGQARRDPVVLVVPATPFDRRVATLVKAELGAVGVKVAVKETDPASFPASPGRTDGSLFGSGWAAEYPRMDAFLAGQFSSGSPGNLTGFSDAGVDRLLAQARLTVDDPARTRIYQQAETAILAHEPVVPVLKYRHTAVLAPGVKGFDLTPWGVVDLAAVSLANHAK